MASIPSISLPLTNGLLETKTNPRQAYIARKVLPRIPDVTVLTGVYLRRKAGFGYSVNGYGVRPKGAGFNRIKVQEQQINAFTCRERGLSDLLDRQEIDEAAQYGVLPVSYEQSRAKTLYDQVLIDRERAYAGLLFSGTTWSGRTTAITGTDRFDDPASNPRKLMDTYTQNIQLASGWARSQLSLVIGKQVWDPLSRNANLMKYFNSPNLGVTGMNEAQVAAALGIGAVIVGEAAENTVAENSSQTHTGGYIWGKNGLLCAIDPNPNPMEPRGIGFTAVYVGTDDVASREVVESGKHTELEVWTKDAFVVTDTDQGYYLTGLVS